MVKYEHIIKAINEYVEKCSDYPKAIALKYWKEHKDEFITETWDDGVNTETSVSPVGHLQKKQEILQEKIDYTGRETGCLKGYSTYAFEILQKYNNETSDWEYVLMTSESGSYNEEKDEYVLPIFDFHKNQEGKEVCTMRDLTLEDFNNNISNAIQKSPRLQQDTTFYRYGRIPDDIPVGGHGTFKGFTGLSYNPYTAYTELEKTETWMDNSHRYKLRVFAMAGTEGIVLNEHTGCRDYQSEYLLNKNQRFIVLGRNDGEMTADILLY